MISSRISHRKVVLRGDIILKLENDMSLEIDPMSPISKASGPCQRSESLSQYETITLAYWNK
jgi:hypothetical protein